jgi:hypothetical protein
MSKIGDAVYTVCLGVCERRLVDNLTHEVIFNEPMKEYIDSDQCEWNPTWDFAHSLVMIDYINSLGYYVGLLQEPDQQWRCLVTSSWKSVNPVTSIVDSDPLLVLSKMVIMLHDKLIKRTRFDDIP